jgi:hypothetical protein
MLKGAGLLISSYLIEELILINKLEVYPPTGGEQYTPGEG